MLGPEWTLLPSSKVLGLPAVKLEMGSSSWVQRAFRFLKFDKSARAGFWPAIGSGFVRWQIGRLALAPTLGFWNGRPDSFFAPPATEKVPGANPIAAFFVFEPCPCWSSFLFPVAAFFLARFLAGLGWFFGKLAGWGLPPICLGATCRSRFVFLDFPSGISKLMNWFVAKILWAGVKADLAFVFF